MTITVTDLFRYPVKSLRGDTLDRVPIGARGLDGDRRWMIVDDAGRFITRRECPDMALFTVRSLDGTLSIAHPLWEAWQVAIPSGGAPTVEVRVWGDTLDARVADQETNAWLSRAFGRSVRLVYQGEEAIRPIDPAFARPGEHVSLSDGYPVLIVSRASLAAVNGELAVPVPITRFRPNIVVDGDEAWGEDRWRRIRIGSVVFRVAKPCSRCVVITQHPETGVRAEGNEPLTTLKRIGRIGKGGVMFGQNLIPEGNGDIAVGDGIEVLETGESNLR